MMNFFKIKKFKKRCRLLAVEWIKVLCGATEVQAIEFIESSTFFDSDIFFDLEKSEEYNTDLAIIRTLDLRFELEVESVSEGLKIYTDLKPGVIGVRSESNLNDLVINFLLGSKYVSHLMTKIEEPVPEGFLTSTILNTEINLLAFVTNFYKWKVLPVALADRDDLPLEAFISSISDSV